MSENGVKTTDLSKGNLLDEVIGNKDNSTISVPFVEFAKQLSGSGEVSTRVLALENQNLDPRISTLEEQTFEADPIYPDTDAGLGATSLGDPFKVLNADPDISYDIFTHGAGPLAVYVASVPSLVGLADVKTLDDIEANFWAAAEKRRADVRARIAAKIAAIICGKAGQSLAYKRLSGTTILSAPGHLMFNGGPYTNDFQHAATNVTWTASIDDMASIVQYSEADGYEGLSRADGIALAGQFDLVASFSAAIGARTLDVLFNGGPRNNLMAAVEQMAKMVEAKEGGRYAAKPIWDFLHGEADASAGNSKADYIADFDNAIFDIRAFSAWAIDDPDYIAPIAVHQMMLSDLTEAFHEILQAQQEVVQRTVLCEFVTSAYPYPHEADEVHPVGEAFALKSEYSKLRLVEMLAGTSKGGSPVCAYATREGGLIRARIATKGGAGLDIDTNIDFGRGIDGATELFGFQFYRNGALIDLTGASLKVRGQMLEIKLAADPGVYLSDEELRYAMQEDGSSLQSGGHLRSGGNVKSLEPAYFSSLMTMHRFTFINGITAAGAAGDGPGGRTITGQTSGATALVHAVTYTSGSFDTDDAQGEFTAYRVNGTFLDGEVVETGAIDMTLSSAPVEEQFKHENWLTRFAVPVTEAAE
ncbi:hypothetical protein [Sulfitobacter sp. SK025]|uniref:hypothetical protein n=1 Tax=Sulfitobacter sp. SK025 TaxID=1389011 RepID=UPI000E0C98AC|nr:hypothetical protein [Sulfitobacter sp. SK025]AXI50430.1 hypothetical protein C1J04_05685 [Sulfitobacter sp. SK025]